LGQTYLSTLKKIKAGKGRLTQVVWGVRGADQNYLCLITSPDLMLWRPDLRFLGPTSRPIGNASMYGSRLMDLAL